MKRMALGVLFGLVLGFGSTLLVALALGGGGLPKPVKFSCKYVWYTARGTDFEHMTYACFRRSSGSGKGQLRSIRFLDSGSGMRTRGTPLGPNDKLVYGGGRYLVMRVKPTPSGVDQVWAEPIR